ncbi:MAG TPA: hypothetical protein VKZ81_10575 [Pseudonocardia sp.]|uniref:hypothetical protein n=1 Tax=Pseudonocardia sp. TaxID=60912 RepID=UPI002B4B218D|nr:hypothetical protein [Pseudonocardia sp.]HLU55893.1 hypothetical protein [Pseudonocardia sp.]
MTTFSIVSANVSAAAGAAEDTFVTWWATEHQPEWVALDGFRRGWFLRRIDHRAELGPQPQRYSAVYEVDGPAAFNAALLAGPPWGPWQDHVDDWLIDWTRTYRDVLTTVEVVPGDGGYWATVGVDLDLPDGALAEFNRWYDTVHLPQIVSAPGMRRAWRLQLCPEPGRPGHLGPPGRRFLAIYETDGPDDFAEAREARLRAGAVAWDEWAPHVREYGVSIYEVRHRVVATTSSTRQENR